MPARWGAGIVLFTKLKTVIPAQAGTYATLAM